MSSKKEGEKKSSFDFNPAKIAKFAFEAYNLFYRKIDKGLQKARKKLKNAVIESFLVLFAIVYLLIGSTMYLEKLFPKLTYGLNFILVGGILLIVAFFHYLATK
ncbi:hypothetical protein C0585_05085 [Candidatus Woesearchaeota archaeon]|mgnify:CR=1 FL=1|nr:MAG: hypothetical protein C0585_05085 [Candidatus Woesearchaeota archaeon]